MNKWDQANALLAGGAPTAKFPAKGTIIEGTILDVDVGQQTDINDVPEWWDAEQTRPKMQVVVTLQTEQQDDEIANDDGRRRLFVKGQMQQAVGAALREAGERGVAPGGILKVQWYDEKPPTKKGYDPQKLYRAAYVAPATDWPTQPDDEPLPDDIPF